MELCHRGTAILTLDIKVEGRGGRGGGEITSLEGELVGFPVHTYAPYFAPLLQKLVHLFWCSLSSDVSCNVVSFMT